jgi:hypothetical protein
LVRVDRCRQWLTEQVPTINAMTAHGNVLLASTTANRLPRTTPAGSTRGPARSLLKKVRGDGMFAGPAFDEPG